MWTDILVNVVYWFELKFEIFFLPIKIYWSFNANKRLVGFVFYVSFRVWVLMIVFDFICPYIFEKVDLLKKCEKVCFWKTQDLLKFSLFFSLVWFGWFYEIAVSWLTSRNSNHSINLTFGEILLRNVCTLLSTQLWIEFYHYSSFHE